MATHTTVKMVDDIDGSKRDVRTVQFAIDGVDYEIDLSGKNAASLGKTLAPYISAGRQASGGAAVAAPSASRGRRKSADDQVSLTDVRAWAATQGIAVASRGRVAKTVIDAYRAAG